MARRRQANFWIRERVARRCARRTTARAASQGGNFARGSDGGQWLRGQNLVFTEGAKRWGEERSDDCNLVAAAYFPAAPATQSVGGVVAFWFWKIAERRFGFWSGLHFYRARKSPSFWARALGLYYGKSIGFRICLACLRVRLHHHSGKKILQGSVGLCVTAQKNERRHEVMLSLRYGAHAPCRYLMMLSLDLHQLHRIALCCSAPAATPTSISLCVLHPLALGVQWVMPGTSVTK